jgi:ArsR family transcriptional regulator
MAGAFARILAGERLDVVTAAIRPAPAVEKAMQAVMVEKGIDLGYYTPRSLEATLTEGPTDTVVTMGTAAEHRDFQGAEMIHWDLPNPPQESMSEMRRLRDQIESRVGQLVEQI